jgi:hypothetical protein
MRSPQPPNVNRLVVIFMNFLSKAFQGASVVYVCRAFVRGTGT